MLTWHLISFLHLFLSVDQGVTLLLLMENCWLLTVKLNFRFVNCQYAIKYMYAGTICMIWHWDFIFLYKLFSYSTCREAIYFVRSEAYLHDLMFVFLFPWSLICQNFSPWIFWMESTQQLHFVLFDAVEMLYRNLCFLFLCWYMVWGLQIWD